MLTNIAICALLIIVLALVAVTAGLFYFPDQTERAVKMVWSAVRTAAIDIGKALKWKKDNIPKKEGEPGIFARVLAFLLVPIAMPLAAGGMLLYGVTMLPFLVWAALFLAASTLSGTFLESKVAILSLILQLILVALLAGEWAVSAGIGAFTRWVTDTMFAKKQELEWKTRMNALDRTGKILLIIELALGVFTAVMVFFEGFHRVPFLIVVIYLCGILYFLPAAMTKVIHFDDHRKQLELMSKVRPLTIIFRLVVLGIILFLGFLLAKSFAVGGAGRELLSAF